MVTTKTKQKSPLSLGPDGRLYWSRMQQYSEAATEFRNAFQIAKAAIARLKWAVVKAKHEAEFGKWVRYY